MADQCRGRMYSILSYAEVPGSDLDTEVCYRDWWVSWLSLDPAKCQNSTSNYASNASFHTISALFFSSRPTIRGSSEIFWHRC